MACWVAHRHLSWNVSLGNFGSSGTRHWSDDGGSHCRSLRGNRKMRRKREEDEGEKVGEKEKRRRRGKKDKKDGAVG